MTDHLVFLDTETTGLDPDIHSVWEIAYAIDDGPIVSAFVAHDLKRASEEALAIGRYRERYVENASSGDFTMELRGVLRGNTIVGANPCFDASFLFARWGDAPWHYRLLDVEAYAMGILGWNRPKGLNQIAFELDIEAPDHTAAGDVRCLRECFHALANLGVGVG